MPDPIAEDPGPQPLIAGLPAERCTEPDCCMCKTTFAEVFCEWICPHCKSHLSSSRVCLNACGLSNESRKRFAAMIKRHQEEVGNA